MLDLFLYDLAVHQLQGNNGVTHGRSYMKDKSRAADQDVFGLTKLLFATSDQPYTLAVRHRGHVPGRGRALPAARGHPSGWPRSQRTFDRPHAHGRAARPRRAVHHRRRSRRCRACRYDDPDGIPFWWERGALTAWQTVPAHAGHDRRARPVRDRRCSSRSSRSSTSPAATPPWPGSSPTSCAAMINIGLLSEVDTVTWRSARRHAVERPGLPARLLRPASTTPGRPRSTRTPWCSRPLPGNEPRPGRPLGRRRPLLDRAPAPCPARRSRARRRSTSTRRGSRRRRPGPLDAVRLPALHPRLLPHRAVRRGPPGRRLDARPPGRRLRRAVVVAADDVAHPRPGGHVHQRAHPALRPGGRRAGPTTSGSPRSATPPRWGSFDAFAAAVTAAPVERHRPRRSAATGCRAGSTSPTARRRGRAGVRGPGPLTVDGAEVPLHGEARFDNPFGTTAFGSHDGRDRRGRRQPHGRPRQPAPATPGSAAASPGAISTAVSGVLTPETAVEIRPAGARGRMVR